MHTLFPDQWDMRNPEILYALVKQPWRPYHPHNSSARRVWPQRLEIKIEVSWVKWSISKKIICSCNPNLRIHIWRIGISFLLFEEEILNSAYYTHKARCTLCVPRHVSVFLRPIENVLYTTIYSVLHFGTAWTARSLESGRFYFLCSKSASADWLRTANLDVKWDFIPDPFVANDLGVFHAEEIQMAFFLSNHKRREIGVRHSSAVTIITVKPRYFKVPRDLVRYSGFSK